MKTLSSILQYSCVAMTLVASSNAFSQSSVTLWGMVDSGITYVSNQGGQHNVKMDDGVNGPNLWGFKGMEDLGGGTKAIFELVSQFQVDNGNLMPNKSLFSRNAYVGLTDDKYGKLTLGNQYDFMTDSLYFSGDDPAEISGHFYDFRAGPFTKLALPSNATGSFDWDRMAGESVTNSVKYLTPTLAGVSFGALYQFGGVAGSIGEANGASFGVNYGTRDLGANAAYTNLKYATVGTATTSVRNWGAGAHARFGKWFTNVLFTTVRNSANGGALYEASMGARYNFTNAWNSGVSYMYMKGNGVVNDNHAHQVAAILEYAFSRRTSVYALAVYQRANDGASAQINGMNGTNDASTTNTQAVARIGLRTRF